MKHTLCISLLCTAGFLVELCAADAQQPGAAQLPAQTGATALASTATLPLWTFNVRSSRDGNHYPGVMVGSNPFNTPGTTRVPTFVIPLVLKTHTLGTSLNAATGIIGTRPGHTTFDPTVADSCYPAPNNIPIKLIAESPILEPALFDFGGTDAGTTQYLDAFQRANFWSALGVNADKYHVLLDPVQFLDPIVIDVPAIYGLAVTNPRLFAALLGPSPICVPYGRVDFDWFGVYLEATIIPALAAKGVNPTNLPIFVISEAVLPLSSITNYYDSSALAFHGSTGFPIPTQTYVVTGFRKTLTPLLRDTDGLAHELGEWINDPFVQNPTPLWGGQFGFVGCQGNLEVGDPLEAITPEPAISVTMPNGYSYSLQELTFFSWFFGAPSSGINGWFSNNGTFLSDAGPPCQE
jgi:hypothetical protein